MRNFVFMGLLSLSLLMTPMMAGAESISTFKVGNGKYNINGVMKDDVAAYLKNNRVYLPLRYVAYACGIGDNSIYWDSKNQSVFLSKGDQLVAVKIGESLIMAGGKKIPIDAPAELKNNRTMLPLRAIAEAFQLKVEWDPSRQQVKVKGKEKE